MRERKISSSSTLFPMSHADIRTRTIGVLMSILRTSEDAISYPGRHTRQAVFPAITTRILSHWPFVSTDILLSSFFSWMSRQYVRDRAELRNHPDFRCFQANPTSASMSPDIGQSEAEVRGGHSTAQTRVFAVYEEVELLVGRSV